MAKNRVPSLIRYAALNPPTHRQKRKVKAEARSTAKTTRWLNKKRRYDAEWPGPRFTEPKVTRIWWTCTINQRVSQQRRTIYSISTMIIYLPPPPFTPPTIRPIDVAVAFHLYGLGILAIFAQKYVLSSDAT